MKKVLIALMLGTAVFAAPTVAMAGDESGSKKGPPFLDRYPGGGDPDNGTIITDPVSKTFCDLFYNPCKEKDPDKTEPGEGNPEPKEPEDKEPEPEEGGEEGLR